jgi:hypothetical protein
MTMETTSEIHTRVLCKCVRCSASREDPLANPPDGYHLALLKRGTKSPETVMRDGTPDGWATALMRRTGR